MYCATLKLYGSGRMDLAGFCRIQLATVEKPRKIQTTFIVFILLS